MEKIKFWVNSSLKLLLIILAAFLIYSWNIQNSGKNGIPSAIQSEIDSLTSANHELQVVNEKYKTVNTQLYEQVYQYENLLMQIHPSAEKKIIEYREASPEKRKEMIRSNVLQMQKEMELK